MNDLTIKQEFDNVKKELGHGVNISIINLVDQLIEKAHELRASDIHIDPLEGRVRIRFRIDGVLHDIYSFPKEINHEVISRIKILTKLRTDEHQATQDGRFRYIFSSDKKFIDFRVSILPEFPSSLSRTRSNIQSMKTSRYKSIPASGLHSPTAFVRSCAKIRISLWWAKFGTLKPRTLP